MGRHPVQGHSSPGEAAQLPESWDAEVSSSIITDIGAEWCCGTDSRVSSQPQLSQQTGDGYTYLGRLQEVKERASLACLCLVDFEEVHVSSNSNEEDIHNAIMAIHQNHVALKGNIETNRNLPPSHKSRNNIFRTSLDLYANIMHYKSLPGVVTRQKDIDILIVRENRKGKYSSLEHESVAGVVESLKMITKAKSLRVAAYAFKLVLKSGRKKVTAVHKANIMKLGNRLFLQCCREITFENTIVDNTTMQLVSWPQQFDTVDCNVCAELVRGPGLVAGANYGHVYAVFETATRNNGKSIANKNIANPTATLLASCMMLDHLKLYYYATSICKAVLVSMDNENMHTPDIGGQGITSEDIISHIRVINSQTVEA
ncbi:Isocitrate dehydrogenase [NAD] subunit gamma 1, mitochondrial [Saguinus oedipus]|uniref:Isocitric dehydrogenase subunit gamma n=1 Tax=Saguinus oedipus TaxID=9490 RepID=A0ABQ9TZU8_SAGOE|nr:Isocitrate dehydrogenase [NAD] subunit gamma 1, mitochondrial [Saguinus oedipus]